MSSKDGIGRQTAPQEYTRADNGTRTQPANGSARVAACVPYYGCPDLIADAIDSLLSQSHPITEILVISDADEKPPWDLPQLRHSSVRKVELDTRMGPFFAIDCAMRLTSCEFMLIQDADDWSDSVRVEVLLQELQSRPAMTACASNQLVHGAGPPYIENLHYRFCRPWSATTARDRFRHHAMYRISSILDLGGYYGGYAFGYDGLLTGVLHWLGVVSVIDSPLYHRRARQGSLTRSENTGMSSAVRRRQIDEFEHILSAMTQGCDSVSDAVPRARAALSGRLPREWRSERGRMLSSNGPLAADITRLSVPTCLHEFALRAVP